MTGDELLVNHTAIPPASLLFNHVDEQTDQFIMTLGLGIREALIFLHFFHSKG